MSKIKNRWHIKAYLNSLKFIQLLKRLNKYQESYLHYADSFFCLIPFASGQSVSLETFLLIEKPKILKLVFSDKYNFSPTPTPALPTKTAFTPNRGRFAVTILRGTRLISVFKR